MKKIQFYALTAVSALGVAFSAAAQDIPVVYEPEVVLYTLSDNGHYAVGTTSGDENADNPKGAGGTLLNLQTKEYTTISAPGGWAEIGDVADDGTVVGSLGGKPGYWKKNTGEWTTFNVPGEWSGGNFTAVTPDGHYAVGYLTYPDSEYNVYPLYCDLTTGDFRPLPGLPKIDMSGEDQHQNVFYGISPDGRYVLGQMSQSYWLPVALFSYVYDTSTDTWDAIGFDFDENTGKFTPQIKNLSFTSTQNMSCDGKYVTGNAYMIFEGGEFEGGSEYFYPYKYNVETKEFEVYSTENDADVAGNRITADGIVLGCSPASNPYPTAQIRNDKFFISLDEVIQQVYGKTNMELIHDDVTGSFWALSADGLTAIMGTYNNCYVITMPEPFAEAASKVDLLKKYSLSIPENSKIGQIGEIHITFDRAIECMDYPAGISLTDGKGNVVRNALSFKVSPTNDHRVLLTFRTTSLNPDEKYTINIPEGMIWLKADSSRKTKAISISYTGREEGAIRPLDISPATGASITQFNATPDYLEITFNTPVAISQNGKCTLYNADDNTVVASFIGAASGEKAIFYPMSTYHLYKGSNYRVVIAEGTVTDLSGKGGCEEITLEYQGAYVRQLTDQDRYIFHSACDDYSDFIFWQTDFDNIPARIPASWGFESGNPWLILKGSTQSDDWALAAHSMFSPAAESNDWLITPQLYIPDENAFLTFDAQNYLHTKSDTLKIYVYEDDAVYNYFSTDLEESFRNDGDMIFKEILTAGATDDDLDGEWTNYKIDLAKYAGKNVYIAFVNQNYDQSAIFINDVKVMRDMSFSLTNQTPSSVVDIEEVTVKGIVTVVSELESFKGIELALVDEEGMEIDRISDADATLSKGDTYNFTFPKAMTLTPGYETEYKIVVVSGETTTASKYSIKNLVFEPEKRVVLEEYTGSSCPNCPLGINAIENLLKIYPDNFIPVTIRAYGNDMYGGAVQEYANHLGMPSVGAPSGRINRGEILSPMVQTPQGYLFNGRGINDSDGEPVYLWADAVQDELETPAEASIDLSVSFDPTTRVLEVPVDVTFAVQQKSKSYGVLAVVMEDKLLTYQDNNLFGISDPNLGEWGAGGMYARQRVYPWEANEVARFVMNGTSFNGLALGKSNFDANETCSVKLSAKASTSNITDANNCYVVVMLIDRTTERIVNANKAKFGTSGITDVDMDSEDSDPIFYDLQGIQVSDPQPGHIYIKVTGNKAQKVRL